MDDLIVEGLVSLVATGVLMAAALPRLRREVRRWRHTRRVIERLKAYDKAHGSPQG